jgi:7,8-dihydroneopterin aldolase/epimerase/oxygenase
MWQIKLNNIKFIAKHGVFAQEQILGNTFIVNIAVGFEKQKIETLDDTIDYVIVFDIVQKSMLHTEALLETVIQNIVAGIETTFTEIKLLDISIKKQSPYFGKNIQSSEVVFSKNY